jgi:hypothetical protein
MKLLRAVQMVGYGLLLVAVPFVIFEPDSRPSLHSLGVGIGVGAAIGVGAGLVFRLFVPLERRLRFIRSLNPRLARRVMPSESTRQKTNADGGPPRLDS